MSAMKKPKYATKASGNTAIALQDAIKSDHPVKNPMKSPNALFAYAYGPLPEALLKNIQQNIKLLLWP